jgi:hypothetical protein
MLKGRRVGTFTAGLVLIIFGILYIIRTIFPIINLSTIASLWPIILVLLGIEIIVSYIINENEKIKYDAGAIILIITLSIFAMGMAGVELIINHATHFQFTF